MSSLKRGKRRKESQQERVSQLSLSPGPARCSSVPHQLSLANTMDSGDISSQLDEISLGDPPIRSPTVASPPPWDTQQPEETDLTSTDDQLQLEQPPTDGDIGGLPQDTPTAPSEAAAAEGPRSDASDQPEQPQDDGDDDEGFEPVTLEEEDVPPTSYASPPSTTASAPTPPLSDSTSTTPAEASSSALPPPLASPALQVDTTKASLPTFAEPVAPAPTSPTSPRKSVDAGSAKQPRLGTSTPNVLQKLVSMTRQRDLPPKAKEEEVSFSLVLILRSERR